MIDHFTNEWVILWLLGGFWPAAKTAGAMIVDPTYEGPTWGNCIVSGLLTLALAYVGIPLLLLAIVGRIILGLHPQRYEEESDEYEDPYASADDA